MEVAAAHLPPDSAKRLTGFLMYGLKLAKLLPLDWPAVRKS
jgi:hypothetical protein